MRSRPLILPLSFALGLTWAVVAGATPFQDQACIVGVSDLRDIERADVSIERDDDDDDNDGSLTEIFFRTPNVRGSCLFDGRNRLIDVRFASGTLPWNGAGGGDVSAQEQACAGEMARRTNARISSVSISDTRPARRGGRQMIVAAPGVRARCVTTAVQCDHRVPDPAELRASLRDRHARQSPGLPALDDGAQERTRTSTPLRAPAPEAGASTNSATWAREHHCVGRRRRDKGRAARLVNRPNAWLGAFMIVNAPKPSSPCSAAAALSAAMCANICSGPASGCGSLERDPRSAYFLQPLGAGRAMGLGPRRHHRPRIGRASGQGRRFRHQPHRVLQGNMHAVHVEGAGIIAEEAQAAGASALVHVSAIGADPASKSDYGRTKGAGRGGGAQGFSGGDHHPPVVGVRGRG